MNTGVMIGGPKDGEHLTLAASRVEFPEITSMPNGDLVPDVDPVPIKTHRYSFYHLYEEYGIWVYCQPGMTQHASDRIAISKLLDAYDKNLNPQDRAFQKVQKIKGYPFPGVIVASFMTTSGELRHVVEATGDDYRGMLHIFSPEQLAPASSNADTPVVSSQLITHALTLARK